MLTREKFRPSEHMVADVANVDDSLLSPCFLCRVSLFSLVYFLVLLGVSSLFLFLLVCFVSRFLCCVSCFFCVCLVLFLVSPRFLCVFSFSLLCLPVFFMLSSRFLYCLLVFFGVSPHFLSVSLRIACFFSFPFYVFCGCVDARLSAE